MDQGFFQNLLHGASGLPAAEEVVEEQPVQQEWVNAPAVVQPDLEQQPGNQPVAVQQLPAAQVAQPVQPAAVAPQAPANAGPVQPQAPMFPVDHQGLLAMQLALLNPAVLQNIQRLQQQQTMPPAPAVLPMGAHSLMPSGGSFMAAPPGQLATQRPVARGIASLTSPSKPAQKVRVQVSEVSF
jgi:hypothetical protein